MSDVLKNIEEARFRYKKSLKELVTAVDKKEVEGHLLQKERDAFWDLVGPPRFRDIYLSPLQRRRMNKLRFYNGIDLIYSAVIGGVFCFFIAMFIPSLLLVLAVPAIIFGLFAFHKMERMIKKRSQVA